MIFDILFRLATKVFCIFAAFEFCQDDDSCEASRRVRVPVDGTGEISQDVEILAVCDQPGTTFENMDLANAPIRPLRDSSGACVLEDTGIDDQGIFDFPVRRGFEELPLSCQLQLGGPSPVEIEFCCPEEDSVAVVMGSFATNSGIFELEALATVSNDQRRYGS